MTEEQLKRANELVRLKSYSGKNYLLRVPELGNSYVGEALNMLCIRDEKFKEDFRKIVNAAHQRYDEELKKL